MQGTVFGKKIFLDNKYHFFELFNPNNGLLIRSNVEKTNKDPFRRSFPELLDIGIMGKCEAGRTGLCKNAGVDCYQKGFTSTCLDMSIENYAWIIEQCKDKVFQVALGGAGDPNKHKFFEEILSLTVKNGIVPNLTTSGYNISDYEIDLITKHCGAVAVSFYSKLENNNETNPVTIDAINRFVKKGNITNVHYVVSRDSIDEAIFRLKNDIWPNGVNAVIFLLYKPVGFGKSEKIIKPGKLLDEFLDLAINKKHSYEVGFDTCFTSGLCANSSVSKQSLDACEAARFSMYIHSDLMACPCSFDNTGKKYSVKLKPNTIQEAWDSDTFNMFLKQKNECERCENFELCLGGCKLNLGIDICNKN